MSFFKQGFDEYDSELKDENTKSQNDQSRVFPFSLKTGETKDIIILDDTGFRFYEYSFYNSATRRSANFTSRGDNDFLSEAKRPALITIMTIKDMAGYLDNNGQRKGVGNLKPLKLKKNAATRINLIRQSVAVQKASEMWEKQKSLCEQHGHKNLDDVAAAIIKKGNVLKNCRLRVMRLGDKAESSGDEFQMLNWIKSEELEQKDVPFNYEEMFAPKTDAEIKAELLTLFGGVQFFNKDVAPLAKYFGEGGTQTQTQGQQASNTGTQGGFTQTPPPANSGGYEEAPNWSADDIPF